jgi:methionyl aminopeptidase
MVVRNPGQTERLRRAGRATARLLRELADRALPGVTTRELDSFAAEYIQKVGGEAVFHTQNRFPACINTSVNDEAVHGVPSSRILQPGDLLKIDCGIRLDGYCGDATVTVGVGPGDSLSQERRRVMETARESLRLGIAAAKVGARVGDIGHAIQSFVEGEGLHLLAQYTGHGLGDRLWEPPTIPAVGRSGTGERLVEGLVITIEPIVVGGSAEVFVADDGWTVRTLDGKPAAQFEHTIVVTSRGARILTAA